MQAPTKVATRTATAASGAPVTILAFAGDIASTSKEPILEAYGATDGQKLLLDFSGTEYVNSSGIAIIIQLLLDATKTGGRTVGIFGLTPHFQKVFTMVGIGKYATLSPNEAAALASL